MFGGLALQLAEGCFKLLGDKSDNNLGCGLFLSLKCVWQKNGALKLPPTD